MNRLKIRDYLIIERDIEESYQITKLAKRKSLDILSLIIKDPDKIMETFKKRKFKELLRLNQIMYEQSFFRYLVGDKITKIAEINQMEKLREIAVKYENQLNNLEEQV